MMAKEDVAEVFNKWFLSFLELAYVLNMWFKKNPELSKPNDNLN